MGLFGKIKESRQAKWMVNKQATFIELHDNRIHFRSALEEYDIFYQDVKHVGKSRNVIKLETPVKEFKIWPKNRKGASDLSEMMYNNIMEKLNEFKK